MSFKGLLFSILIAFSVTSGKSFASGEKYPQLPYFGPNCWNFSLMYKKAMPFYRTVSMHEFWYYMNTPYCRELKKNESPRLGDIGSAISAEYGIVHSFILISPSMTLSKGSPYPDNQIDEQPLSELSNNLHFPLLYHRCDFSNFKYPQGHLFSLENRIDKYLTNQLPIDSKDLIKILEDLIKEKEALTKTSPELTLIRLESLIVQTFMLIPETDRINVSEELFVKLKTVLDTFEAKTLKIKSLIKERFK